MRLHFAIAADVSKDGYQHLLHTLTVQTASLTKKWSQSPFPFNFPTSLDGFVSCFDQQHVVERILLGQSLRA